MLSLRRAIAERVAARWGRDITSVEGMVTAGAAQATTLATRALVEDADEVLIPDPGRPSHDLSVAFSHACRLRG